MMNDDGDNYSYVSLSAHECGYFNGCVCDYWVEVPTIADEGGSSENRVVVEGAGGLGFGEVVLGLGSA